MESIKGVELIEDPKNKKHDLFIDEPGRGSPSIIVPHSCLVGSLVVGA